MRPDWSKRREASVSKIPHTHMKDKDITAQAIVGTYLFVTLLVFLAYFS